MPGSPKVRAVIIAPTHNNAKTLRNILQKIDVLDLAAIIVNDGSTDQTAEILAEWSTLPGDHRLLNHPYNQGKAAALRTAFVDASQNGYTHAITIDTDGQLSPEDILPLLHKCFLDESALVLGVRDATATDYPLRSRIGRWVSNLLVRFETGHKVTDSQCGLRIYPLALVNSVRCRAGHYGFETEIITRALWAGVRILEAPVQCQYFKDAERVSHFKPFVDSMRALWMHARLIAIAIYPIHRRHGVPGDGPAHSLPRQFLHWLNPITAWRQIRHVEGARTRFAAGFAIGVFIANLPVYGIQTIIGLFVARRFRLHPASVVAGVNIAVPPINAIMIAMGIAVGHLILHGSLPHWQEYHLAAGKLHAVLLPTLVEWIVGSIVLGAAMGAISFALMDFLLGILKAEEPE